MPAERGHTIPCLLQSQWDISTCYLGIRICDSQVSVAPNGLDFKEINTYGVLTLLSSHDSNRYHLSAGPSIQDTLTNSTHLQGNTKRQPWWSPLPIRRDRGSSSSVSCPTTHSYWVVEPSQGARHSSFTVARGSRVLAPLTAKACKGLVQKVSDLE